MFVHVRVCVCVHTIHDDVSHPHRFARIVNSERAVL